MIYLITGVPGSGKTLLAVQWIKQWQEQGRAVYADIDGLNMTRVGCQPHAGESPRDWRETPEGSVVVYDEAQGKFPSTAKPGRPNDDVVTAMEEHRHSGHDLLFLTQHSTMLHHHVRKLVGQHIHVKRAFGGNAAVLFTWGEATDERDGKERHGADKETFRYPKALFRAYKSATVHTHKFRMPRKVVAIVGVVVVLVGLSAWAATNAINSFSESTVSGASNQPGQNIAGQMVQRSTPAADLAGRPVKQKARPIGDNEVIGGNLPERLDGAELSSAWRLVGILESESSNMYILRGRNGDTTRVPSADSAFVPLTFSDGVLVVKGPGGRFAVTRYTGPDNRKERQQHVADRSE